MGIMELTVHRRASILSKNCTLYRLSDASEVVKLNPLVPLLTSIFYFFYETQRCVRLSLQIRTGQIHSGLSIHNMSYTKSIVRVWYLKGSSIWKFGLTNRFSKISKACKLIRLYVYPKFDPRFIFQCLFLQQRSS